MRIYSSCFALYSSSFWRLSLSSFSLRRYSLYASSLIRLSLASASSLWRFNSRRIYLACSSSCFLCFLSSSCLSRSYSRSNSRRSFLYLASAASLSRSSYSCFSCCLWILSCMLWTVRAFSWAAFYWCSWNWAYCRLRLSVSCKFYFRICTISVKASFICWLFDAIPSAINAS